MRRLSISLFIIIGIATASAESLLDGISARLAAMGCYKATFTIAVDGTNITGHYIVEGQNFYVATEGVELYVADGVQYQVDATKREVVVDSVSTLGSDILSNPAQSFETLKQQYNTIDGTQAGGRSVRLTPKQGGGDIIDIYADSTGALPHRIVYSFSNGGSVTILLSAIEPYSGALPRFEQGRYAEYEVIDMR